MRRRVQLGRLGSGNIVEGQSLLDTYVIYLPLSDTCEYLASGVTIEKDAFAILEPGCDCCLSTKFEHDWCSIFIPADNLPSYLGFEETRSENSAMVCRTTRPSRSLAHQFRTAVREVLNAASNYPDFGSSLSSEVASAELMELGAAIIRGGTKHQATPHGRGRPKLARRDVIRLAQECMEERDLPRVRDLVTRTGVPERTLRRAFYEFFGVSP